MDEDGEDEDGGDAIRATLEAICASEADGAELAKMLQSLNALAATALRSGASQANHAWARALTEGFLAESHGNAVTARWLLPANLLEEWSGADH